MAIYYPISDEDKLFINTTIENNDCYAFELFLEDHHFIDFDTMKKIVKNRDFFWIFLRMTQSHPALEERIEVCLHICVQNNDVESIDAIIDFCPKITTIGIPPHNCNIMHYICGSNNYDMYMKYVKKYEHLLEKKNCYYTPAIRYQRNIYEMNYKIINEYLCGLFSRLHSIDFMILGQIANNSNLPDDNLKMIVDLLSTDNEALFHVLSQCIYYISDEMLNYFLNTGIDFSSSDDKILIIAIHSHRIDLFYKLLEYGVAPSAITFVGLCEYDKYDVAKKLYDDYKLDMTIRSGTMSVFSLIKPKCYNHVLLYLLDNYDIDFTEKFRNNETILHIISRDSALENLEIIIPGLIERGVNPYTKDKFGYCFFHNLMSLPFLKIVDDLGIDLAYEFEKNTNGIISFVYDVSDDIDSYRETCDIILKKHLLSYKETRDMAINDYLKFFISNKANFTKFKSKMEILIDEYYVNLSDDVVEHIRSYGSH